MKKLEKILLNAITLFGAMVAGVIVGLFCPQILDFFNPVKSVYVALMKVLAMPILICAVVCGLGRIFKPEFRSIFAKFIIFTILTVFTVSLISCVIAYSSRNVMLSTDEERVELAKISSAGGMHISDSFKVVSIYSEHNAVSRKFTAEDLIKLTITDNIFAALAENASLQILVFFILFGIFLNFTNKELGQPIIRAFEGILQTLSNICRYVLLLLPFALFVTFGMLAANNDQVRISRVCFIYIIVMIAILSVIFVIGFIMLWAKIGISPLKHLSAIKRILFVSLGATDKTIILPVAIEDSITKLKLNPEAVEIAMPVCNTVFAAGRTVFAAVTLVFAVQIYELKYSATVLVYLFIASALFGVLGSCFRVNESLVLFSAFLKPLGLGDDLVTMIFAGTQLFYMGYLYFVSVYTNIVVTAYIAPKSSETNDFHAEENQEMMEATA